MTIAQLSIERDIAYITTHIYRWPFWLKKIILKLSRECDPSSLPLGVMGWLRGVFTRASHAMTSQLTKTGASLCIGAGLAILQNSGKTKASNCMHHNTQHADRARPANWLDTPGSSTTSFAAQIRAWQTQAINDHQNVQARRGQQDTRGLTNEQRDRLSRMFNMLPPTVVTTGICPHWFCQSQCVSLRTGANCPWFHPEFIRYDVTTSRFSSEWSALQGAPLTRHQVHWMINVNRCRHDAKHPGTCRNGVGCHKGHMSIQQMCLADGKHIRLQT